MGSRLPLPAKNTRLSLWVEPQSETSHKKAHDAICRRAERQPARPFRQIARGGKNLTSPMAKAAIQVRKANAVKEGRADRLERKQRRRQNLVVALLSLGLVGVALLHVWLRLQVVHMGYVLSTTSKLQSQLEQESRELKVELATLTSPDRLEAMARKRLGLAPPEKGQVIVLP